MRQQEKNYRIPTTSTPKKNVKRITTTSTSILNLHTPTILTLVGKEYMCFQKYGKTSQAIRCIKSKLKTKVIDYALSIYIFEQQCVLLKVMLQSPLLKDNVNTIGIDQSLRNNDLYEHNCLENITI